MSDHQAGRPGTELMFEVLPVGPCGRSGSVSQCSKDHEP
jgi:hypothetical protein